jgi:arylsulfatase A-like enzyme
VEWSGLGDDGSLRFMPPGLLCDFGDLEGSAPELPNSAGKPYRHPESPLYAVLDLSRPSAAEEYEDFWRRTEIREATSLSLAAPKGSVFTLHDFSWLKDSPYREDAARAPIRLEISATLTAVGAAPAGSALASLSAIELATSLGLPEYEDLPGRMRTSHAIGEIRAVRSDADGSAEAETEVYVHKVIELAPSTTMVAVAFGATHSEQDDVRFELANLRVREATPVGLLLAAQCPRPPFTKNEPDWKVGSWGLNRLRRFQLDWTSRFGFAVPSGATLDSVVNWPAGGRRARLWAGLLPTEGTDPSASAELVLTLEHWSESESHEVRVTLGPEARDRWQPIDFEVPYDTEDRGQALLSVRCIPVDGSGPWALPVVAGFRAIAEVEPSARTGSNLLLVSLDTLRADHVGGYGYERDTTPRLDEFARQALRFTNVWSTSAYTLPAHLSMLSGQLPSLHGVERPEQRRSPLTTPLLAEQLAAEGYATAAFTGGAMMLPDFGFASGFERYGILDPSITLEAEEVIERLLPVPGFDRETVERHGLQPALDWVDEHSNEPWFLFVHTYAAHEFEPPPRFLRDLGLDGSIERDEAAMAFLGNQQMPDERARRYLIDRYDGGVRAADEMVGRLLDHLDERDLRDDTVILITSDHGKEIGDRNQVRHGHSLQEEMVHVPLWLSAPGLKPGVIDSPKSLIDVAPTLIELLGLPPWPTAGGPEALQPRSLLERGNPRRELWAELDNQGVTRAWRQGSRKTIHNPERPGSIEITPGPEWQGYDLDEDPFESNPLEVSTDRRATLEALYGELRLAGQREGDGVNLGAQQKALLEALGYTVDGAGN